MAIDIQAILRKVVAERNDAERQIEIKDVPKEEPVQVEVPVEVQQAKVDNQKPKDEVGVVPIIEPEKADTIPAVPFPPDPEPEPGKFSMLRSFGENYCQKTYITNPAIGRDEELQKLILVLLTPEKSAILTGKPGIGKTAIIEGLAYRIEQGNVPDALKGFSVINVKTASLLGSLPNGESRLQLLIDELKEREKTILFIDEIHMLIGATAESSVDFANIFKEGLGRGTIKVVGATTTEEYERYILRDKAFTRRFQRIEVAEPTRLQTIRIMMGTLPKIEKQTGAKLKYSYYMQTAIMTFYVDLTSEYRRVYELGSRYPDCSLTILKQAFSYAVFDNRKEVNILDVRKSIENSKGVYPDVIRKELPRFDKTFASLIAEEGGLH